MDSVDATICMQPNSVLMCNPSECTSHTMASSVRVVPVPPEEGSSGYLLGPVSKEGNQPGGTVGVGVAVPLAWTQGAFG